MSTQSLAALDPKRAKRIMANRMVRALILSASCLSSECNVGIYSMLVLSSVWAKAFSALTTLSSSMRGLADHTVS